MFCEGRRAMEGREVVGKSSGGEVRKTDEKEQKHVVQKSTTVQVNLSAVGLGTLSALQRGFRFSCRLRRGVGVDVAPVL